MIHAVTVMNTPRITKFYENVAADEQQEIISAIYSALSSKGGSFCNVIEADIFGLDTQLVYKHFATLYSVFAIDKAENELAIVDLIQLFVELLDKAFKNVCELDIVYNFNRPHLDAANYFSDSNHIRLAGNEPVSEMGNLSLKIDK